MARSSDLKRLKTQFERLRRDTVETVSAASKIISQSVHSLAEKDLKMLESSYKSLLRLAESTRKDGVKDVAGQQIEAMQKMIDRMLDSARESLALSAQAREELARLLLKGEQSLDALTRGKAAKIIEPARKALVESQSVAKGKGPAKGKPARKPASRNKAAETPAAPAKRRGRPPKPAAAADAAAPPPVAKAPAKRRRKPASEKMPPAQEGSGDAGG